MEIPMVKYRIRLAVAILLVTAASHSLELSSDTINVGPGLQEKVWIRNTKNSTVKLDSFFIQFVGGTKGSEIHFRSTKRQEINGGPSHDFRLNTNGDIQTPINLRDQNQNEVSVPPRDSIYLDQFLYGNCLLCLSGSSYPNTYSIKVHFFFLDEKEIVLKIDGNYVAGGIIEKQKWLNTQIKSFGYRIDGKKKRFERSLYFRE